MKKCLVISHRGANRYAPQNTLPAFERSVKIGTDGFETDVHITRDGKIVLCHNYTIDETSNGKGNIADMTLDQLKSYDFGSYFSKKFAGTKIPTIDEFLSFVETTDISLLNIEIKSPKQNETAIVRETMKAVKEHGLFDKLLISSFDPRLLVEAKQIDKNCKTGFLYSPNSPLVPKMAWRPVAFAQSIGADALHPHFVFVNKRYVEDAHKAGILVNPWTVDSDRMVTKMIDCGVDGIITDFPDLVGGMLERYSD
ncbi:MAG: glycerophosphodiester phosphodiesterase [Acutalibacteraceae bacterium]